MSSFDRDLTLRLTRALERDDMREQTRRINGMMTTVSLFVQKLGEARHHINEMGGLNDELNRLKRKRPSLRTEEDEQRILEITEDIKAAQALDRQYKASKSEVTELIKMAKELDHTLQKI